MWPFAPNRTNSTKSHVHWSVLASPKASQHSLTRFPQPASQNGLILFWKMNPCSAHMDSLHICQLGSRPCFLAALRVPFSFPCFSILRYQETKAANISDSRRRSHANIYQKVKQKDACHIRSQQSSPSRHYGRICVYIILYYSDILTIKNMPSTGKKIIIWQLISSLCAQVPLSLTLIDSSDITE